MYSEVSYAAPDLQPCLQGEIPDFGIKLYKGEEVRKVEPQDTRNMWNILVFDSPVYTLESGCVVRGAYVSPILSFSNFIELGDDFSGYLISIPTDTWKDFDANNLGDVFSSIGFNPFVDLDRKDMNGLMSLMAFIEENLDSCESNETELIFLLRALIASLSRFYSDPVYNDQPMSGNCLVDGFIRLVDKYCLRERKLEFYAKKLDVSVKYLSKVITSISGKKAGSVIAEYSIEKLKDLLLSSSISINDIAGMAGFYSPSDFCRFFKFHTGVSPAHFRKETLRKQYLDSRRQGN